jgi:TonB family protein
MLEQWLVLLLCYLSAMRDKALSRVVCGRLGLLCVMACTLVPGNAGGQDAAPAPGAAPAPSAATVAPPAAAAVDGNALMMQAAKANGLKGADMQPWHLKASYKILDEQGTQKDEGTFEELWVSSVRYKQTFIGQNYSRTEFGTEKGIVFTGTHETPRAQILEMAREFVAPLPDATQIANLQFEAVPLELGTMHLSCLQIGPNPGGIPAAVLGHSFCINTDKPALRVTKNYFSHTSYIYNHIASYQGRFVAGDLVFQKDGKTIFTAHVDSLTPLTDADSALLQPPTDALPLEIKILAPKPVAIAGALAQGMLLQKISPDYPQIALDARVSGTVVLQAVIGKDGQIENLHAVSGPPMLRPAALEAVKKWVYRPYLLNGEPVSVETTINVVFNLGGKPPF